MDIPVKHKINTHTPNTKLKSDIKFSKEQLEYLERLYPAHIPSADTPENKVHQFFGEQRVIHEVRLKTHGGTSQQIPYQN